MGTRPHHAVTGFFLVSLLGAAGCAEVYVPRPNGRVAITSDAWGGFKIAKHGKQEPLGATLGSLEDAVRDEPRAAEEARSASTDATVALVTGILGSVSAGVGAGLLTYDAGKNGDGRNENKFPTAAGQAGIGLLGGAIALIIVSSVFRGNSQTRMFNAVNTYNDNVVPVAPPLGVYGGAVPAPGYRPLPGFQGPQWGPPPGSPGTPSQPAPLPVAPPAASPGGGLPPVAPLPPGALPAPGTQPVPLSH